MSNPLAVFRKNRNYWMAGLVLLAILAFVVAPAIQTASEAFRGGADAQGGAVVVRWDGGKMTVADVRHATIQHGRLVRFLNALAQKVLDAGGQDVATFKAAGKILSVNQNMRYDQSMRVLKQIIESGALGDIVFAQIDMHAIPHWQGFLEEYDRLTLANMSVHHLDVLRFLFGDPDEITTLTRKDPRTAFDHSDGITVSTLRFPSGVLALSLEDVWSGPREDGYKDDQHINWRVDGTLGVAKGTIGWPTGAASTLSYASTKTTGGEWVSPTWDTMWFPHAFIGVMEQLQHAVKTGEAPALSVADNVKTMALVEAAYRSIEEKRTVELSEIAID